MNPTLQIKKTLQRQKRLFTKRKGKNVLRAGEMNIPINVWSRLIKKALPATSTQALAQPPSQPQTQAPVRTSSVYRVQYNICCTRSDCLLLC